MRWIAIFTLVMLAFSLFLFESIAFAFENTMVLPKGVRGVGYLNIQTSVAERSNNSGQIEDLATPLQADLSIAKMVEKREGFEQTQLRGFVQSLGMSDIDSLGTFTADLRGSIHVQALTVAYGITDRFTLGFALPYYSAQTSAAVGFKENRNAERIVSNLYKQGNISKAREAAVQINAAAANFHETLALNGYKPISEWKSSGIGDVLVKSKYLVSDQPGLRVALLGGLSLPTGRVDDPDHLTDIPFGDGTFDQSLGVILDQPLFGYFFLNEYAVYTYQAPARRRVRLVTDEEPLVGESDEVRYKLGDRFEMGSSFNFLTPRTGFVSGIGYQYHRKFGDRYNASETGISQERLERDTHQENNIGEFLVGYNTIEAFRRGEVPVPFITSLLYQRQLRSLNTPITHRIQFDATVFF